MIAKKSIILSTVQRAGLDPGPVGGVAEVAASRLDAGRNARIKLTGQAKHDLLRIR